MTQLTLGLRLRDDATFDNFYVEENEQLLQCLKTAVMGLSQEFIYLWGNPRVGKSHLLQACCHHATQQGLTAAYIPLSTLSDADIPILDELEHLNLICIDDLDAIKASRTWQEALMFLYNRAREEGAIILFSAQKPPSELAISLLDLNSRLAWGLIFQLHPLSDYGKVRAIQMRAQARGFLLSTEVGLYLLRRCSRDIGELFLILEKLDQASLSAQRKLTIPFVKLVLRL